MRLWSRAFAAWRYVSQACRVSGLRSAAATRAGHMSIRSATAARTCDLTGVVFVGSFSMVSIVRIGLSVLRAVLLHRSCQFPRTRNFNEINALTVAGAGRHDSRLPETRWRATFLADVCHCVTGSNFCNQPYPAQIVPELGQL